MSELTVTGPNTTPGYKTTEFWLSVLALAMPVLEGLQHFPSPWISLPAAAIAGAYALSRSQTKKAASGVLSAQVQVAPSVLAAQQDKKLPDFGAMTVTELNAARAANGQGPVLPPPQK